MASAQPTTSDPPAKSPARQPAELPAESADTQPGSGSGTAADSPNPADGEQPGSGQSDGGQSDGQSDGGQSDGDQSAGSQPPAALPPLSGSGGAEPPRPGLAPVAQPGSHSGIESNAGQKPKNADGLGVAVDDEPPAKKVRTIRWAGRIFFRNTSTRVTNGEPGSDLGWTNDLHLDSARMAVKFRDRSLGLRVDVEAELGDGEAKIRDGFIRWQPRRSLRVQFGRFREPTSLVSNEARWSLPVIERGLLNDFELINELTAEPDELYVGQRNIGIMVELRSKMPTKPRLTMAVFRSRVHAQLEQALGGNRQPLSLSKLPEDVYMRADFEPIEDVHVGVTGGWFGRLREAGTRDTFEHSLLGSVDVKAKLGQVRLWLEAFTGATPIHLGTTLLAQGRFVAYRGLASMRFKFASGPIAYLEPFTSAQYLDASSEVTDDTAYEYALGLVTAIAKSWRVHVSFDQRSVDSRFVGSRSRLMLQGGVVF